MMDQWGLWERIIGFMEKVILVVKAAFEIPRGCQQRWLDSAISKFPHEIRW
jgi:hypothetical protein